MNFLDQLKGHMTMSIAIDLKIIKVHNMSVWKWSEDSFVTFLWVYSERSRGQGSKSQSLNHKYHPTDEELIKHVPNITEQEVLLKAVIKEAARFEVWRTLWRIQSSLVGVTAHETFALRESIC